MKKQSSVLGAAVTILLVSGWLILPVYGIELADGLDVGGYIKNETYVRIGHGTDIMSSRNVFNLDINYSFPEGLVPKRLFIQLRPFYDAVFDLENEGTGGGGGDLRDEYQDNFGEADDWDPLVRELWLDVQAGDLYARLGRQLVVWGKSDGVYLLDLIHPFNYRNLSVFEEEDTKIPLWMANINYSFSVYQSLQLLVIPRYVPQRDAGDGHFWAANVTKYVEDFYADPGYFFGMPGLLPPVNVDVDEPDWNDPSDWEVGLRWSGMWRGLGYTLNYFYTWDDVLNDYPQDPFGMNVKRTADRLSIFGFSFDYAFDQALGMENWVLTGEFAYFKNDVFVDESFHNIEKNHIDFMLRFDKPFFVDYNVSIQLWQSWILNSPQWDDPFLNVSARLKELVTIPGVGTVPVSEGFRDTVETALTLYIMKDYMPGDWLHTEWFLYWNHHGDWWFRPKVKYDYTTNTHFSLGFNFYWGDEVDLFGEFHENDNVFFEFKYDF